MSAAASVVVTVLVVGFSTVVGPETSGPRAVHEADGAEPEDATPGTSLAEQEPAPAEASQVGETRSSTTFDTTLLEVRTVPAPADRSAPAGQEWYGIRARTCMHADAEPSGEVLWSDWVVVTESGTRYAGRRVAWDDFPPQQYSVAGLGAGQCTVGWILVPVPLGTDVVMVTFRPSSPHPLAWAV